MHPSRRDALEMSIRRFVLAAWDMDAAAGGALALQERLAPGARHALETGLVVCYARPFTNSEAWTEFGAEWAPPRGSDRLLHNGLLQWRDKYFAHTDQAGRRDIVDLGELCDDEPLHAVEYGEGIREELLPRIVDLCEAQRDRFKGEKLRLEKELKAPLSEGPDPPPEIE